MYSKKRFALAVVALSAAFIVTGCGKKEEKAAVQEPAAQQAQQAQPAAPQQAQGAGPVITKFGPAQTKAGQVFNKQPNGESAFWANGENISGSTVVVLNGTEIKSAPQKQGTFITAGPVPKELYAAPGNYPLYLLDKKSGAKSNEVTFVVK